MIKSEVGKGLISRGTTKLDLSIVIEQTGPMQLTVRKGAYTETDGTVSALLQDQILSFNADANFSKSVTISLVKNISSGAVDVWVDEVLQDGLTMPGDPPSGYQVIMNLVGGGWFIIPAGCVDLSNVDIYCFKVIN